MRISRPRGWWLVLGASGWACFFLVWIVYPTHILTEMDRYGDGEEEPATAYRSLREQEPPLNSVMLLEGYNNTRLTLRMYCALESAARAHYPTPVVMFMTAKKLKETRLLESLTRELSNIQIVHLDVNKLFEKSPLAEWFTQRRWEESDWPLSHFNDAIRWLLLWYYGGVYLDLDVVVKRPLTELPNCTGLESSQWASAGVLKFTPAHPLIRACLDHFAAHFDGKVWGANGPKLLTRVLTKRWGKVTQFLTLATGKGNTILYSYDRERELISLLLRQGKGKVTHNTLLLRQGKVTQFFTITIGKGNTQFLTLAIGKGNTILNSYNKRWKYLTVWGSKLDHYIDTTIGMVDRVPHTDNYRLFGASRWVKADI
nr:lactosylceramide 4-alpha-galactosyltransferase-like [Penaeus vannamei]